MKNVIQILFATAIALVVWACAQPPGGIDTVPTSGIKPAELEAENEWIYDELCKSYYWRDAVRAVSPKAGMESDEFLSSLLSNLPGAQDNSETPPTIDGGYSYSGGKFTREPGCYSYVEITENGTRADGGMVTSFGFDVYSISGMIYEQKLQYVLLVNWVQPGSPADLAGIERGMWIYEYDNGNGVEPMDMYDTYDFWYRLHYLEGGNTLTFADETGREYSLAAAPMKDDPIIFYDIITSPVRGERVAYLVYNAFESGEGYEFDDRLREIFGEFKAANATQLVLDLRYNLGGAVTSSRLLASLAGNVNNTKTFTSLIFNDDAAKANRWLNPEVMRFNNEPNSLKLNKIYVLTTDMSASSSELVINSLRGVLGDTGNHKNNPAVTIIGERTEGKNVGMTLAEKTIDGKHYQLWPITFKTTNAVGFCNYAGGFEPNYYKDELYDVLHWDSDTIYPFGDENERLLKAALTLIDGGTVSVDPQPYARAAETRQASRIGRDARRGGAKIIRDADGNIL